MNDSMDDRRKGLEEEYFHRKNKEAVEKMREKVRISQEAKSAGTSTMECPRCDGKLITSTIEQIEVDTCDKCGGLWLDSGEFEQLMERDQGGWLSKLWKS